MADHTATAKIQPATKPGTSPHAWHALNDVNGVASVMLLSFVADIQRATAIPMV